MVKPSRASIAVVGLLLSVTSGVALAGRAAEDDARSVADPRVQHRSYEFPGTGEKIPYALFVPADLDPARPAPLMVALHGLGRTYDWLMGYHGLLDHAQAHGFIVVTPLGYVRQGWYGARATDLQGQSLGEIQARSEQDVMNVLARVRAELNVDADRIFLWGHSMGGAGTYHLAARYPEVWAGIGLVAPAVPEGATPAGLLPGIRHLPTIVLHGTADELIPVEQVRTWVRGMRTLGMQHVYLEIPGGDHSLLISQDRANMKRMVDFFGILCRCLRAADSEEPPW